MPKRIRKSPPRPGPNARHGGDSGSMHFVGHVAPKIHNKIVDGRKSPTPRPVELRSIAELYGNDAVGDMTERRARWKRWEERKDVQRERATKKCLAVA